MTIKCIYKNVALQWASWTPPIWPIFYGTYFEDKFKNSEDPCIAFFGHFINNILAIVYAPSANEALQILSEQAKYDGVDLTWSALEWTTPFLDMQLFISPTTGQIEHKPYCKLLNHMERISWVSHHPFNIKH